MGTAKYLLAGALLFFLVSCTSYRIHLKVLPETAYNVILNDEIDKGTTDSAGKKDFSLVNVSLAASPKLTVTNRKDSGFVVLDGYIPQLAAKNLDSLSVVKGPNGDRIYDIRFIVDPVLFREKHPAEETRTVQARANAPEKKPAESAGNAAQPQKPVIETGEITEDLPVPAERPGKYYDPTRSLEYARKIATTGAACYFVGLGLAYVSPVLLLSMNPTDTGALVGMAITSLLMGAAAGALQIAGTSYSAGGAALAWELGQGKCDASQEHPLSVWTFYKGGWVFTALSGIFSAITSLIPVQDQGTALTLSVISLGLNIGRDVFWSISNAKALTMTRRVKECLEEQNTPAHHIRFELNPYATRGGMGMQCTLKF
jgi:hypothetical protein